MQTLQVGHQKAHAVNPFWSISFNPSTTSASTESPISFSIRPAACAMFQPVWCASEKKINSADWKARWPQY
ncbi:MAG: hypothetical protein FJ083_09950 [Cyanobacteria bacterium K_Offshore_surface_m2_239]|nr:hypothetical protein [Cyanobacteria bacterium K_Offshore_surface_m2_239]